MFLFIVFFFFFFCLIFSFIMIPRKAEKLANTEFRITQQIL
jgi:hypothetical protein